MENREKTNGGEAEIELINQLYIGNKIENKKNTTLSDRNSFKIQYCYTTNMVNILENSTISVFLSYEEVFYHFRFFYHTKRYSTI